VLQYKELNAETSQVDTVKFSLQVSLTLFSSLPPFSNDEQLVKNVAWMKTTAKKGFFITIRNATPQLIILYKWFHCSIF
jgi:hypothetical protein